MLQRVVLFNFVTGQYYKSGGQWTNLALNAHDFKDCHSAVKTGADLAPEQLVLMLFDEGNVPVFSVRLQDYRPADCD
jgi:hypothetical protein